MFKYAQVMTPFARAALIEYEQQQQQQTKHNPQQQQPGAHAAAAAAGGLGGVHTAEAGGGVGGVCKVAGLEALVKQLVDSKLVLGCQVCVIQKGVVLADLVAGVSDPYTLAPVRSNSLFNVFSVTKAVAATALHLLVQVKILKRQLPTLTYEFDMN